MRSLKTLPFGLTNCVTLSEWKIFTSCMPGMEFIPIFFKTDCNRLSSLLTDLCIAFFFLRKKREPGSMSSFLVRFTFSSIPFHPSGLRPPIAAIYQHPFLYSSSLRRLMSTYGAATPATTRTAFVSRLSVPVLFAFACG